MQRATADNKIELPHMNGMLLVGAQSRSQQDPYEYHTGDETSWSMLEWKLAHESHLKTAYLSPPKTVQQSTQHAMMYKHESHVLSPIN